MGKTENLKLEKAKKIIKKNIKCADCGLFDCGNYSGDRMETLYDQNGLTVLICYDYAYFEVFGLSDDEFKQLSDYYEKLCTKLIKESEYYE